MNLNGLLGSLLSPTAGHGAPLPLPPKPAPKDADAASDPTVGVMAQISDAAKAMFAQMKHDGVAAESFDLHLDLRQLGLKVDASGARSLEGHSLSVDLHVEAHQGTVKTDNGEASFQSLDVSFSLQETWVKATEGPRQGDQAATQQSDQAGEAGKPQGQKPQSMGGFVDGLKKLIDLLHQTDGQPGAADGLGAILAQIGHALEAMAKRLSEAKGANGHKSAEQPDAQLQGVQLQEDIHVHALHVEIGAVQDAQGGAA